MTRPRHPALLRLALALVVIPLAASCVRVSARRASAASDPAEVRAEISTMMARSAASWNRGDLDAFVSDYEPGERTTYIGSRGLLRDRAPIRAAYAPRFAPGAQRDSLTFELKDVDVLAPDVAHVIAWYVLTRRVGSGAATRDSVTSRGPTSLLMRRSDGRWRIVHDHSS
jgi:uncharacterized protein (TIGR02246 family)